MIHFPVERTAEAFTPVMLGNKAAAQFLADMVEVLHVWDDLIDRDKPVDPNQIHAAFMKALITLPRNEFYMANFAHLNAILVNAISNWHIANKLEADAQEYELRIAYILRSSYVDLVTQCAMLVGGPDYARELGYAARKVAHKEGWDNYLKNLHAEFEARAASMKE
jgi:hypothetical protein